MATQPFIGVVCDASFSVLVSRIKGAGYRVARVSPAMLKPGTRPAVDIWVVDCEDHDAIAEDLAEIDSPVVALSNRPEVTDKDAYRDWSDRIIKTLDKWTADAWHGKASEGDSTPDRFADVEGVWLIVGSAGAEAAAREFFEAMPWVPNVAFLYAQHVKEKDQLGLTNRLATSNPGLRCNLAVGRHWFNPAQLLVVPSSCRLQFGKQGEVFSLRDSWGGRVDPHIDQVMMSMTALKPSGVIVFSGASTDGLKGAHAMRHMGIRIWAQEPETATEPALPTWVDRMHLSTNVGNPAELAADFVCLYGGIDAAPTREQMTPRVENL